jgi:hypothetical protein
MAVQLTGFGSSLRYALLQVCAKVGIGVDGNEELNRRLRRYPSNHVYRLRHGLILPSPQLARRMKKVVSLYSADMCSLLDIGCCRGGYVLEAARRPACRVAVGVDVWQPFIELAESARQVMGIQSARFHNVSHEEVAEHLDEYGGPFHTVLNLGTYHYLFWGSERHKNGTLDHRRLFAALDKLCSNRLIISCRLEVSRCPTFIRQRAAAMSQPPDYDQQHFLLAAREFFEPRQVGHLGSSPLFLMTK